VSGRKEVRLYFRLNTPITAFEDGDFDEKAHAALVKPVYARIKYNDGITTCFVAQYGIEVKFFDDVTNAATVTVIVNEAIRWAVEEYDERDKLFPLRGGKTPTATLNEDNKPDPNAAQRVRVIFSSHLTRYLPNGKGGFDQGGYQDLVESLAKELTDIDGITSDYVLGRNGAVLWFDPKITTREVVEQHMYVVFHRAAGDGNQEIFPFLSDKELVLAFAS
jgi:hypothetical protein